MPRGWEDLSDMMRLYEQHDIWIDYDLVYQHSQNLNIAREFATYYELFNRYKKEYQLESIFKGISFRIANAKSERKFLRWKTGCSRNASWTKLTSSEDRLISLIEGSRSLRNPKKVKGLEGKELSSEIRKEKNSYEEDFEERKIAGSLNNEEIYAKEFTFKIPFKYSKWRPEFENIQSQYMKEVADLKSRQAANSVTPLKTAFTYRRSLWRRPRDGNFYNRVNYKISLFLLCKSLWIGRIFQTE